MSFILYSLKQFFVDILGSIFYFPVWWYGQGLALVAKYITDKISQTQKNLAIGVLFRYLFKPMYADYSRTGWAISVVIRFIHLLVMLAVFFLVVIFWLAILLFYLGVMPVIIYFIYQNSQALKA